MPADKKQGDDPNGHRKRCRERLLKDGAKSFSEVELLEMLLFYVVARADTRPIAEALINKYGSISELLCADVEEIAKTPQLKDGARVLFTLLRELVGRSAVGIGDKDLLQGEKLKQYLIDLYRERATETVYALYFADDGTFMGRQVIYNGGISSARFSLRSITEGIIRIGGKTLVLAHNHPSGSYIPSTDDIISTKRIAAHLAANEIELIEHYVVTKDNVVGILYPNKS